MCKINCSGGYRECSPDEHPKPIREIRVGDTIWLKGEPYGMRVSYYGLNEEGWFMCYSPGTMSFALLDEIAGWTDPETSIIYPVDISEIPKPPQEALED